MSRNDSRLIQIARRLGLERRCLEAQKREMLVEKLLETIESCREADPAGYERKLSEARKIDPSNRGEVMDYLVSFALLGERRHDDAQGH